MYEKLEKIRADLERARKKREEADAKVKQLEAKLKEAENTQIIADVGALNLSPEQVAELLKLVKGGQMPISGNVPKGPDPKKEQNTKEDDTETKEREDEEDEEM